MISLVFFVTISGIVVFVIKNVENAPTILDTQTFKVYNKDGE